MLSYYVVFSTMALMGVCLTG